MFCVPEYRTGLKQITTSVQGELKDTKREGSGSEDTAK
jgi:hypothetical protein